MEEELLLTYYSKGRYSRTTTEIYNSLMTNFKGKLSIRKLGQALKANGFERVMDPKLQRYVWLVVTDI